MGGPIRKIFREDLISRGYIYIRSLLPPVTKPYTNSLVPPNLTLVLESGVNDDTDCLRFGRGIPRPKGGITIDYP